MFLEPGDVRLDVLNGGLVGSKSRSKRLHLVFEEILDLMFVN